MIAFDCPYCDNHLEVPDEYAGRDGWCRACKQLIIVPAAGEPVRTLEDVPIEERCVRLERKLKYAATKADRAAATVAGYYKAFAASRARKDERLARLSAQLDAERAGRRDAEASLQAAQAVIAQRERELAATKEELDRLRDVSESEEADTPDDERGAAPDGPADRSRAEGLIASAEEPVALLDAQLDLHEPQTLLARLRARWGAPLKRERKGARHAQGSVRRAKESQHLPAVRADGEETNLATVAGEAIDQGRTGDGESMKDAFLRFLGQR